MTHDTSTILLGPLYAICCLLLTAAAHFVYRRRPHARLHRDFANGCLFVVTWLASLFIFQRLEESAALLIVGRVNFAAMLYVAIYALLVIRELAKLGTPRRQWIFTTTAIFALVTAVTPLIDREESVIAGEHITHFGPVFPLYILFVIGFLGSAIWEALSAMRRSDRRIRHQLSIITLGIIVSSGIASTTNLILPYFYGIFAFQEIGALSILGFIAAFVYAITVHHLFDVRIVVRKTVVFAVLVTLVEKIYSFAIDVLVAVLPADQASPVLRQAISVATVLFIAWSFDPIRRWLDHQLDRLMNRRQARRPATSTLRS